MQGRWLAADVPLHRQPARASHLCATPSDLRDLAHRDRQRHRSPRRQLERVHALQGAAEGWQRRARAARLPHSVLVLGVRQGGERDRQAKAAREPVRCAPTLPPPGAWFATLEGSLQVCAAGSHHPRRLCRGPFPRVPGVEGRDRRRAAAPGRVCGRAGGSAAAARRSGTQAETLSPANEEACAHRQLPQAWPPRPGGRP
mmetsp:Transcript_30816/g.74023  ORF Transcript_30816/g.74023 Transcript_30816/m.74023 type:complete len:200 (+) Transcript_30816:715-1314(+)